MYVKIVIFDEVDTPVENLRDLSRENLRERHTTRRREQAAAA